MKMKRLATGTLAAVIGASMLLSACTGGSKQTDGNKDSGGDKTPPADAPVQGGTFVYTTIGDAKVLLPTLTEDTASSFVTGFVFDPLMTFDDKLNLQPGIANGYKVEQDKIYTFDLKKDVKFHDGQPLTAKDAVFTFLTVAHPKYQGARFGSFTSIKGWQEMAAVYKQAADDLKGNKIDEKKADELKMAAYEKFVKEGGLSAPDDHTFRVELAEPYAPFLTTINSYGIMPKHRLESHLNDLKASPDAKFPVGSGSMKFVEWVKDDHITLKRNADWKYGVKQKNSNIDQMVIKVVPDQQANMVALETGESDYASILPDNFTHFQENVKDVQLLEYQTFSYTYLGYNHLNPMFADKRVRQAITHAINRQQIVDQILQGHGTLANTHSSPIRWDFNPNSPVFEFSAEKAEKLLDEAGWKKGADGIREKDGQKMKFQIATNNGNKLREQSAVIIQQALKKVGMDVSINLMEWNAFLDFVDSDKKEAYVMGWSLGFDPDAHVIFHSEGGFNLMHSYKNPTVDDLLIKGRQTTDQAKRAEIYKQIQQILAEDQVYTWLYFGNSIVGVNKRVKGPLSGGPAGLFWNYEEWWLSGPQKTK